MSQNLIQNLILENKLPALYVASTGAGATILPTLWQPGISKFLYGFQFPYSNEDFIKFTGYKPEKFCSLEAACSLAQASYLRLQEYTSLQYTSLHKDCVGIGISAAVQTNRTRKGNDQCFIALRTKDQIFYLELNLNTIRLRDTQESIINDAFVDALQFISCIGTKYNWLILDNFKEKVVVTAKNLIANPLILSGSFNPLHYGHIAIANHCASLSPAYPLYYEICTNNADKGTIDEYELNKRLMQFYGIGKVLLTDEPLYLDRIYTYCNRNKIVPKFIIGADTFERILNPKYGFATKRVIDQIRRSCVSFYIVDRSNILQMNRELQNIITDNYEQFTLVQYNIPISSTILR